MGIGFEDIVRGVLAIAIFSVANLWMNRRGVPELECFGIGLLFIAGTRL